MYNSFFRKLKPNRIKRILSQDFATNLFSRGTYFSWPSRAKDFSIMVSISHRESYRMLKNTDSSLVSIGSRFSIFILRHLQAQHCVRLKNLYPKFVLFQRLHSGEPAIANIPKPPYIHIHSISFRISKCQTSPICRFLSCANFLYKLTASYPMYHFFSTFWH